MGRVPGAAAARERARGGGVAQPAAADPLPGVLGRPLHGEPPAAGSVAELRRAPAWRGDRATRAGRRVARAPPHRWQDRRVCERPRSLTDPEPVLPVSRHRPGDGRVARAGRRDAHPCRRSRPPRHRWACPHRGKQPGDRGARSRQAVRGGLRARRAGTRRWTPTGCS